MKSCSDHVMRVPLHGCSKSECRLTYVRMQWVHWTNCALSTPCCQLWRHGAWFVYVNCLSEILSFRTLQWLGLALSKGPNRTGFFPHLRTETSSFRNGLFPLVCFLIPGRWIESENSIFLKGARMSRTLHLHTQNTLLLQCHFSYTLHIISYPCLV
jgi:hypothetical protein